jgi:tryptophanyl-tRNA synthetase
MGWGQFKPLLAETVIESLRPIQERYRELREDRSGLEAVLRQGRHQAEAVANRSLARLRDALGFLPAS